MKLQVFTVFDKAVGAFLQPFYCRSKGEAIRSFTEASNDPQKFLKHALDYSLVHLGEFDDVSGLFTTGDPERVLGANEVLSEPRPSELEDFSQRRLPM